MERIGGVTGGDVEQTPLVLSEGKACSDVLSKATKALKNSASLR